MAMSVPGSCRGWQRACQARCRVVTAPVSGRLRDPGCGPGGGGACCNTSAPWPGRPVPGEAGFRDRDDREDLPAVLLCLDAGAVAADLAAGTLACPSCPAGQLAPWGYGRERAVRLRGGRTARLRPRRARCRSCRRTRILLPSWCAPRRADGIEVIGAAAGLAMAGAGHRPVAAALGVPAATARGWLRRLRARAGQLRAHAIGELGGLGFYPPGPPSEPAGSPLGDALNAVAAAVDCARRNFGHRPGMTWPLAGRPGPLPDARPRQLITCRRSGHHHARDRAGDAHRGQLLSAPRHPDQITATMTTNPPPDARNARIYVATANVAVMDILSGREQAAKAIAMAADWSAVSTVTTLMIRSAVPALAMPKSLLDAACTGATANSTGPRNTCAYSLSSRCWPRSPSCSRRSVTPLPAAPRQACRCA